MHKIWSFNRRILLIDDDEGVRDNFKLVLAEHEPDHTELVNAATALFDDEPTAAPRATNRLTFDLDVAASGREGFNKVRQSITEQRPYAAIFCDIRMPGWDGLETVDHIREVDRRTEVIFVTAYSDYDLDEIVDSAGANVSYFVKPFSSEELRQVATKAVLEWNKARELETLMQTITSLRGEVDDLERLLEYLLGQLCLWLDTRSAALAQLRPDGTIHYRLGVGELADPEKARDFLADLRYEQDKEEPVYRNGVTFFSISEFGLAIALTGKTTLTADRSYLIRVFLEHASVAIRNAELHARLMEAERMAAVGQAVGYIVHDLRNLIGNAQMLLHLAETKKKSFEEAGAIVRKINDSLDQALHLASDTLEFSRGTLEVHPEATDLTRVLQDELELWTDRFAEQAVQLVPDLPETCRCRVDPVRIRRVVHNLIKNALEAVRGQADARVRVAARCAEEGTRLVVADNGPGVPDEIRARLFQPFASHGKQSGTGFGLAIVKQIIDTHGGSINLETDAQGTRFTILLPEA